MATRGIDVRQSTTRIVFRVSLKASNGAKVTTGTTELRLLRVNDDGTLDVYDWTTNNFVAPGSGTPDDETTMTHRVRRDSSGADVDSGVWTTVLSTLTNFTKGQVYIAQATNSSAVPESQEREFQFGGVEGHQLGVVTETRELDVDSNSKVTATLEALMQGLVPISGTIGSTGNDTTHLHLSTLTYADTKLVDWMVIFLDVSTSLYYFSPIITWVNSTALATLGDALPVTPQNATDKYWLIPPNVAKLYISKALFRVDPADHDDVSGSFGQRITGADTAASLIAGIRADLEGGTPIPVDVTAIDGDTDAPTRLKASANTMIEGTVNDANFTPTTTQFRVIGPASSTTDNYKNRRILITSGALQRQVSSITASSLVSGETHLTLSPALTAAPADGVTIIIV